MATTVEIPQENLDELVRLTGASTKKAAINYAVDHVLQILRQNEAIDAFRSAGDIMLTPEEARARHDSSGPRGEA